MAISPITNGEVGATVRAKLNELIENARADGGLFDISSGSAHDLAPDKYYVTEWDGSQDMPPVASEVSLMYKEANYDGVNGQRINVVTASGVQWNKVKLAGGWEDWTSISPNTALLALANNEMVKWDTATGSLVGTGDINTDSEINYGAKNLTTIGTVTSGVGTLNLGESQSISSAGTNAVTRNLQTGAVRSSVDTEYGTNVPINRIIGDQRDDIVFQPIITETMPANVVWELPVTEDTSLVSLLVNAQASIENCKVIGFRDGTAVWSSSQFDLVSGATQRVFDSINTSSTTAPFQFENDGATYTLQIASLDGDVFLLGDTFDVPFYALSFSATVDRPNQTLPDSTGVVIGMVASLGVTPDTAAITAGHGYIMSDSGAAATFVRINEIPTIPVNVTVDGNFALGITISGNTTQVAANSVDASFIRDNLLVAFLEVEGGSLTQVAPYQLTTNTSHSQFFDLSEILGAIRGTGLDVNPNADLTIEVTAGELGFRGAGSSQTNRTPNILRLVGRVVAEFDIFAGLSSEIRTSNTTFIDPTVYDDGTVLPAPLPLVPNPENATIQYIYQLPFVTGGLSVKLGETVYPTLEDAIVNRDNDVISLPLEIATNALLLAIVCVRADATVLNDDNHAVFYEGAKFGSTLSGGSVGAGGAGGGDTLGAAAATINELTTFATANGKSLSSESDISALSGLIKRLTLNGDLTLEAGNPLSKITINGLTGDITFDTGDGLARLESSGRFIFDRTNNAEIEISANNPKLTMSGDANVERGRVDWNITSNGDYTIRSLGKVEDTRVTMRDGQMLIGQVTNPALNLTDKVSQPKELQLTGNAGESAAISVRAGNPEFNLKNEAGADVARFEHNNGGDGLTAIRDDGGATISMSGTQINHDLGPTTMQQTPSGLTHQTGGFNTWTFGGSIVSLVLANTGGASQGFFTYGGGDVVSIGRSAGGAINMANDHVEIEPVLSIGEAYDNTRDYIVQIVDDIGWMKLGGSSTAALAGYTADDGCLGYDSSRDKAVLKQNGQVLDIATSQDVVTQRTALTPSATVDMNFIRKESIYTLTMNQTTTLTFSNLRIGHAVQLELQGNFNVVFPGTAFEISGSQIYNTTVVNLIYFYVSDAGIVDYTIQQRG